MSHAIKPTRHQTTVTHLVMDEETLMRAPKPQAWDTTFSFSIEPTISLTDYRTLYDAVGRKWHWVNRRKLNDKELAAYIHHPHTKLFVLRVRNIPIGFIEMSLRELPLAEIIYVGVIDDYIGQGLGSQMLVHSLAYLADAKARRVIIQTCTLDHPSALPLYQKIGFRVVSTQRTFIIDDY